VPRSSRQREPQAETFLWVRVAGLAAEADRAVDAARSRDVPGLRARLHQSDTLTSAIWTNAARHIPRPAWLLTCMVSMVSGPFVMPSCWLAPCAAAATTVSLFRFGAAAGAPSVRTALFRDYRGRRGAEPRVSRRAPPERERAADYGGGGEREDDRDVRADRARPRGRRGGDPLHGVDRVRQRQDVR